MKSAERSNFFYRTVPVVWLLAGLLLLPGLAAAQVVGDCGDIDPIGTTCPLDTWVLVLAVAAVVFAVLQMQRKQRAILHGPKNI